MMYTNWNKIDCQRKSFFCCFERPRRIFCYSCILFLWYCFLFWTNFVVFCCSRTTLCFLLVSTNFIVFYCSRPTLWGFFVILDRLLRMAAIGKHLNELGEHLISFKSSMTNSSDLTYNIITYKLIHRKIIKISYVGTDYHETFIFNSSAMQL